MQVGGSLAPNPGRSTTTISRSGPTPARAADQYSAHDGAPVTNQRAYAADPKLAAMGRFRPLIEVSQQTDGTYDFAQRLANWEIARLRGRSQAVHVVCDKWRDEKNRLWTPNMLAPVHLPALKLVKGKLSRDLNELTA